MAQRLIKIKKYEVSCTKIQWNICSMVFFPCRDEARLTSCFLAAVMWLVQQEAPDSPSQPYLLVAPPVQPALHWLCFQDTPPQLPHHSLTQAPPGAAEQPGYTQHTLFKQASFLLTQIGKGSEGQRAGNWHSCVKTYLAAILFPEAWGSEGAGGLCGVSQCRLTSCNQAVSAGDGSKLRGGNTEWTEYGVRWGLQLCL